MDVDVREISYEVDINNLDKEWIQHPQKVKDSSDQLAECKKELSLMKRRLEVLEAEISLKIRKDPNIFGIEKITEKVVESLVISDSKVERIKQEIIKLEYHQDIYRGSISALDAKKKALEDLVYLWGSSYYSSPKAPEIAKEKMEEAKRKAAFGKNKSKE